MEETGLDEGAGDVARLADLLAYREGTVSAAVLYGQGGSAVLHAINSGHALRDRVATGDALLLGVEGAAEVHVNEISRLVEEGDAVLINADARYTIYSLGPCKLLFVTIRGAIPTRHP